MHKADDFFLSNVNGRILVQIKFIFSFITMILISDATNPDLGGILQDHFL